MQQTLQVQHIDFNIKLLFADIDFFRKAICAVVRKLRTPLLQQYVAPDLFYNHDDETNNPINRYPLIQYCQYNGQARLTGINQGAEAIVKLAGLLQEKQNLSFNYIHINGRDASLHNALVHPLITHNIHFIDGLMEYGLHTWLPMEEDRYSAWKDSLSMHEKLEILNEALPRQLAYFLMAVGFESEQPYVAFIGDIKNQLWMKEFNTYKLAFDCSIACNLNLPAGIGIGQVPSIGFGRIINL